MDPHQGKGLVDSPLNWPKLVGSGLYKFYKACKFSSISKISMIQHVDTEH